MYSDINKQGSDKYINDLTMNFVMDYIVGKTYFGARVLLIDGYEKEEFIISKF